MAAKKPETKPKAKAKAKRGRPPTTIDYETIEKLAMMQATLDEIASFIGFSREGLRKRRAWDEELVAALEKGQDKGKISLRRLQWEQAQQGDRAMLIWLGKQILGQRDKHEQQIDGQMTVNIIKPDRSK
jgi:hypothetical protein